LDCSAIEEEEEDQYDAFGAITSLAHWYLSLMGFIYILPYKNGWKWTESIVKLVVLGCLYRIFNLHTSVQFPCKEANYFPRKESLVGAGFPRTWFSKEWRSYI